MRKSFITVCFILMAMTWNINAQVSRSFKWLHPFPQGNTLKCVKMINENDWVAIGFSGTFMKSTNAGADWKVYNNAAGWQASYNGKGRILNSCWFLNASTGLVCGANGWIARTTNGGTSWDSIASPVTATLFAMHFVPSTNIGYASGTNGVVLKTTNAGLNWAAIPTGTTSQIWNIFPLDTMNIYTTTISGNVLITNDGGANWVSHNTGGTTVLYDINFINPDTGMVCGSSRIVRVTTNGGVNWTLTDTAGLVNNIYYELASSSILGTNTFYIAGNSNKLYKTTNYGLNWIPLPYNDPSMLWVSNMYSVDVSGSNILVGGALGLLYKSTNNGANWISSTSLLSPGIKYDVYAKFENGKIIAVGAPGTAASGDQVLVSSNGGANWTVSTLNSRATYYSLQMLDDNIGWMCGSLGALRKTTDGGMNWDSIPGPFGSVTLRRIEFVNANTGFIFQGSSSTGGGWKTTNGGNNWSVMSMSDVTEQRGFASSFLNANTGYVGNYTPKLNKTTNGGLNWTALANTPMGSGYIYGVQFFSPDTGYVCGTDASYLCRTLNGGTSFDTVPIPFHSPVCTMKWKNYQTGWIFGINGFAGSTTNSGTTWTIYNVSGDSIIYGSYLIDIDTVFAVGLGGSVLKLRKETLVGVEWSAETPVGYSLKQNYPNPFNPETTIEFAIPKPGFVSLKIYDIAGREISNAINMNLNAGTMKYRFNGANISSGVYFYRLYVNGQHIDTKKMIFIK
jgi:photosystem II stability/assembly factor-like uncharacterized protein